MARYVYVLLTNFLSKKVKKIDLDMVTGPKPVHQNLFAC